MQTFLPYPSYIASAVAVRGQEPLADHLLVLTISAEGHKTVIYNGPAAPVWVAIAHKAMPDNVTWTPETGPG